MNARQMRKVFVFVCTKKKKANEKKGQKKGGKKKGLEPLFALFCRPIDFKKTYFTILILLILVYILKRSHTYIYNIS